jgi:hypothetical protein
MFFGTFESNSEIAATIQVAPNDKPLIVHYGSYVNGWRVVEITRHHLVLALNDHTIEFSLFAPRAGRDAANTSPTEQQSPFPPGLPAPPYR